MADNGTAASAPTIAWDDIGGVAYQRVKLTFGVDGAAADVSASTPMPVTVANASIAVTGAFYQATQPVSGTVGVSGSVGVTGTFWQATQPVSGTVTVGNASLAVTGAFYQATQPVSAASLPLPSGAATSAKQPALGTAGAASADVITVQGIASGTAQPVSGTFWQATQPVSGTVTVGNASLAVTGTFFQATQPVSLASLPALSAGTAAIGKLAANTGVTIGAVEIAGAQTLGTVSTVTNLAQLGGTAVAMGTGVRSTGTQRVTIATDDVVPASQSGTWNIGSVTTLPALVTGAAVIGRVGIDQTTPGTTNLVALAANQSVNNAQIGGVAVSVGSGVTGTGVQRVTLATDVALPAGTNTLGTTTGPTLTKGTQGSSGYSTQDLKDAGRAIVNAATAIAGVTAVTTEALVALNISRDGAATASATTHAVTSGKRWRITGLVASARSTAATVLSARIALRLNPSGAATATSPIIAIASMTQQAAALAEAGDTCVIPLDLEISGTMQVGLSQVCSGTGGVIYGSLLGYEY